ncbi:MAG: hypothetical protein L3K52_05480 [Candidatus Thiothrix sulfatifontis]|nr:MAG: hypothetical protein L3K52_05480 [Candidatus Thiothrix sulfatifontis]
MFVIFKNGIRLATLQTFEAACRMARSDAAANRGNYYTVWDSVTANRETRSQHDKPLYKIDGTQGGNQYLTRTEL